METLENIFINEYKALKNDLDEARKRIEELENQDKEDKQEKLEEPVVFRTVSKEVCRLEIASEYSIIDNSDFKNLSSKEIKEIIDDTELLREYANKPNAYYRYDKKPYVSIKTYVFPYTAIIQGEVVLVNVYDYSNRKDVSSAIMGKGNKFSDGRYYDIKERDKLYEYGLEKFKEVLEEVYQRRLKEENKDE